MKKTLLLFCLAKAVFCTGQTAATPPPLAALVAVGTKILLETAQNIHFQDILLGETVQLRTRTAVILAGKVLVRAGEMVRGEVGLLRNPDSAQVAAIGISPREVLAADGSVVRFDGRPEIFEGMTVGENLVQIVAGSVFAARTNAFSGDGFLENTAENVVPEAPDKLVLDDHEPQILTSTQGFGENFEVNLTENPSSAGLVFPSNLEIWLTLHDELVPELAKIGDPVAFQISKDVVLDDDETVVFQENAPATGRIKHRTATAIYIEAVSAMAADGQQIGLKSLSLKIGIEANEAGEMLELGGELVAKLRPRACSMDLKKR